ncbi:MAG: cytidylate kinase-like family protein [Terriglobia bacterium]|jgi:cytidylate kinase
MFKVLTIAREYGSGGAVIGRRISERLGWKLLDKAFIDNVAHAAKVDPQLARRFDERTDSWLQRLAHQGAGRWRGAFEGAVIVSQPDFFDAETMAALAQNMIEEACQRGNCVIVGRGAQCVLRGRKNAFHVFIYAPWAERVARVRQRLPGTRDIEGLIRSTDRQRADFIRTYFGCNWMDPHLYHLMICSELGEALVESTIVEALAKVD